MRPLTSRLALFAVVVALLAGMGVAHGLLTDRWATPDTSVALDRLPFAVGDWDGTPVDPAEGLPAGEAGSILLRRYINRVNGSAVTLFLTTGRAGPIAAAHAPDSCYPGAGFACPDPVVQRPVVDADGAPVGEFRVADYSKTERASPLRVRVFWGWTDAGLWQAPADPRMAFVGKRRLYKMYVIRQLLREGEPLEGDPAIPFIQALAPELKKSVLSPS
jgi:hypothetical protein